MPMFGAGFGKATPWSIDERGAIPIPTLPTSDTSLPAATVAHRPGFFAPNGVGVNLLGGLADGVSTALGGQAIFAPGQQARQQRQQQLQDYERKRADDLAQWQAEQQFKLEHPAPVNNDTVNDYQFIAGKLGSDAANSYLRNLSDPYVNTTLPGDRFYSGPRSGLNAALGSAGGGAAAPTAPVGKLTPIQGGVGSQARAPFPLRPSTRW